MTILIHIISADSGSCDCKIGTGGGGGDVVKWFKIILPPVERANNEPSVLLDMFVELFTASAEPRNMALFSSDSSPNTFYIRASRQSIPYIRLLTIPYSASACHKPMGEKLNFLSGQAEHVDKVFLSFLFKQE